MNTPSRIALLFTATLISSCTSETTHMPPPAHTHHAIDYIEFTVTDMNKAQRFYAEAFSWKFTDYGPE